MKNSQNLGRTLNKAQQKSINGGGNLLCSTFCNEEGMKLCTYNGINWFEVHCD